MTPVIRALIIEDEAPVRRLLRHGLQGAGYHLIEASTGAEGLSLAAQHSPDVVLLDLGLPDMDGVLLLTELRAWYRGAVVVLSARGDERTKVAALDAGADDYVPKPFGFPELLARLRVALRHTAHDAAADDPVVRLGGIEIDRAARRVRREGEDVHLTPTEYKLLMALIQHRGKVLTQRQIVEAVWGPKPGDKAHDLRVYMARLRQKLDPDPSNPRLFQTELGVGYRVMED